MQAMPPILLGGVREKMAGTQIYQDIIYAFNLPKASSWALMLLAASSAVVLSLAVPAAFAAEPAKPMYGSWGVDLTARDQSVKPGDNFDKYVNGAWEARTEIPSDQASAGAGYDVYNRSQDQLRTLIETADASTQIGGLYKSFIDEARLELTEVACTTPYDAKVQSVLNFDDLCPTGTEEYRDPQGRGIVMAVDIYRLKCCLY